MRKKQRFFNALHKITFYLSALCYNNPMNIINVTDFEIPEMQLYVGNKEVHLLRAFEPEPGIFIAESKNVINIALDQGYLPISAIALPKMENDPILSRLGEVPVFIGQDKALEDFLGYKLTSGIVCAMRRKVATDYERVLSGASRIVVLEDVENPINVGAIFRSAAALGMDGVLLSPACADPLYRRALRVAVGNVFKVPWAFIGKSEATWQKEGIDFLKSQGFTTVAMALRSDNINIDDTRLKECDRLALIMGNEGNGLTQATIDACDYVAKIPMMNGVDSLNVAVASSIAFWELGHR